MAARNVGRSVGLVPYKSEFRSVAHGRFQWRTEDLARVVAKRIDRNRPVIVDGVLVLDALDKIGRKAGFLVFVSGEPGSTLASQIAAYRSRQRRLECADFTIDGYRD